LLRQIKSQSQATVADVRRLVYALRPPALDELGLAGALQATITSQTEGLPLDVDFRAEELPPLPAAVEVAAYRIVSEALNNVIQHAEAGQCTISLGIDGAQGLAIEVLDDGIGLADGHEPGVGLRSMQERAEELGGLLEITSPNGSGTCVRASLPLGDGRKEI
jgi:signal transduction histidine kinase